LRLGIELGSVDAVAKSLSEEPVGNLLEILESERWSKALFTTYSLSLSFFEAFILPRLEAVGCGEISILVDESFYLESLSERQASYLGKSYRLHPISCCKRGIFHPKVTYLMGDETDLIAVGSGNLTYAGHGGSLECIDFARSQRNPQVFLDFAGLMQALLDSSVIELNESRSLLSRFQTRASRVGNSGEAKVDGAVLLHSVRDAIGEQVVERLKEHGVFRKLVGVSPFHHPEGKSIADLAKGLAVGRVAVCLDPDGLRAPFKLETLQSHGVKARFVIPEEKENRHLHAKWYEFHGAEDFVLTGSVNATETSLWSTDNVEVAILRPLNSRERPSWIECDPKRVQVNEFIRTSRPYQGVVVATLMQDGTLNGRVFGVKAPVGKWAAQLRTMLGRIPLEDLQVSAQGDFTCAAPEVAQDSDSSVQITLSRGKDVAAGWVSIELYLEQAPDTRGARLALGRLSRGEAAEGDVVQIVQWLTTYIQSESSGRGPTEPTAATSEGNSGRGSRMLTYEEWASGHASQRGSMASVSGLVRQALATLARGREVTSQTSGSAGSLQPNLEGESDLSGRKPLEQVEFGVVYELIRLIDRVLNEQPDIPIGVDLALFKAEHSLRTATGPELEQALASRGLEWVRWVTTIPFPVSRRFLLEPIAVAMAACVAGLTPAAHLAAWTAELRQLLQKYLSRWVFDDLKVLAQKGSEHRIFNIFLQDRLEGLLKSVEKIWNARTILDDLEAFIAGINAGTRPKPTSALQQTIGDTVLKALMERARGGQCKFGEVEDPGTATRCPWAGCGVGLDPSDRSDLRARRGIRCRGCARAILWRGI